MKKIKMNSILALGLLLPLIIAFTYFSNLLRLNGSSPDHYIPESKLNQISASIFQASPLGQRLSTNAGSECDEIALSKYTLDELVTCFHNSIHTQDRKIDKIKRILFEVANRDLPQAYVLAMSIGATEKDYILPIFIQYTASLFPEKTRGQISHHGLKSRNYTMESFYRGLATRSPADAINLLMDSYNFDVTTDEGTQRLLRSTLAQWAKQDASSAIEWLQSQSMQHQILGELTKDTETILIVHLLNQNASLAEKHILSIENGSRKSYLIEQVVNYWANLDAEVALDWARLLEDPTTRSIAMSSAIDTWMTRSPDQEELISMIQVEQDHTTKVAIATAVASALGQKDPKELARIYDHLPIESRDNARQYLIQNWVNVDFESTQQWVDSRSNDIDRDWGMKYMVSYGLDKFPSLSNAMTWVQSVTDEHLRFELSLEIAQFSARKKSQEHHELSAFATNLSSSQSEYLSSINQQSNQSNSN